jgi:hypothetical protein
MAFQRFRAAETANEERYLLAETTHKSTAYNTKWALEAKW